MKFMLMHKQTKEMEKGLPPDAATLQGVGAMMGEAAAKGIFGGGEGLRPTSERVHLRYVKGKRVETKKGPFTDATELPAGFALLSVRSHDEALSWLDKFAALLGDVEIHVGPVVEMWHLGMGEKPKDAPLRFLAMHMATPASEADTPPDAKLGASMDALVQEMTEAGVLQSTGGLASTKHGARVRFQGGKHSITDGPFAESKELVAGYAIFELPSKKDAFEWAVRFGDVVKVEEIDIRQMF